MPEANPGGGGGTGILPTQYQSPPPPPPPPTTTSSGDTFSHKQLENLWIAAGGKSGKSDIAAAIAQAESQGYSAAIDNTKYPDRPGYHKPKSGSSPEFSVGLWQINLLAHTQYTEGEMLVAPQNARAAVQISSAGEDFTAWSTYNDGSYKQYLTGSQGQSGLGGGGGSAATPSGVTPPAKSSSAWDGVTGFFDVQVPKQHTKVGNLADSFVGIFGG